MNDVCREYGGALFQLAVDEGVEKELFGQTETVRQVLLENPDYIVLLTSPELSRQERESAVEKAFSGAHPYLKNFLRMMVARGYARELADALLEYERLYNERFGIAIAVIRSATELSSEEKARLVLALSRRSGKEISPQYRVEPELLGGICVEMDGVLYDGTVRNRLNGLRESLSELTL